MMSFPSIIPFTAGNCLRAAVAALVKKLMKPRPTPCFSLNESLYFLRISITALISTSLKVVSMAVVFLAATSREAIVLRRPDIFSRLVSREKELAIVSWARALRDESALGAAAAVFAPIASALVILPSFPEPWTEFGSTPFSARIFAAAGDG